MDENKKRSFIRRVVDLKIESLCWAEESGTQRDHISPLLAAGSVTFGICAGVSSAANAFLRRNDQRQSKANVLHFVMCNFPDEAEEFLSDPVTFEELTREMQKASIKMAQILAERAKGNYDDSFDDVTGPQAVPPSSDSASTAASEGTQSPKGSDAPLRYAREECIMGRVRITDILDENPLIGESDAILQVYPVLERIHMRATRSPSRRLNVLLLGEPGTGKQVVAETVHRLSGRQELVQKNAPAMQGQIALTELFGAVKGAYTGLDEDREGLFAAAANGVLFLDNMQRSGTDIQAALLNAIEQSPGHFHRVGDAKCVQKTSCWFVAAINEPISVLVSEDRLIHDLPRRFDYTIHLPSLRDRPEDIPALVEYFIAQHAVDEGTGQMGGRLQLLSDEITAACQKEDWSDPTKGNVGGLQTMVTRLLEDELLRLHREGDLQLTDEQALHLAPVEFAAHLASLRPDGLVEVKRLNKNNLLRNTDRILAAIGDGNGNPEDVCGAIGYEIPDNLKKPLKRILNGPDGEWTPFFTLFSEWFDEQVRRATR